MLCILVFTVAICFIFFFSSRRRHTRCALVTGVQTCALPISDRIELAGTSMSEGARLNRNVVELNRIEYRLAANPSDATAVADLLTETTSAVKGRLATAEATADLSQREMLARIRALYENYEQELEGTLGRSEEHTSELQS